MTCKVILYDSSREGPIELDGAHDPDSKRDYSFNYYDYGYLKEGETITASTWSVSSPPTGVTLGSGAYAATFDDHSTTVWVVGITGSVPEFVITNEITTSNTPPRIDNFSMKVKVAEK